MKNIKVLLVEDDQNFGAVLKAYLNMNDFIVDWEEDGGRAIQAYNNDRYDLCILDVMLPNKDGFKIAEEIKTQNPAMPLIFLTAKSLKPDILKGYQLGADDYITKPFDSEVLIYKINAILRRNTDQKSEKELSQYEIASYTFDVPHRLISRKNITHKLSPKESELLELLCQNMNSVLYREHALRTIWGEESYFTTRSMDVFITKLRKYLKEDNNIEIENIHGSGYSLKVKSQQ
jgi:DNA-binding response OmpR family regulator